MTTDQTLKQAIAHHQAGQLQDAEKLYLAILKTHPNHPEANHNMGVLAVQTKQPLAGLSYLMAALKANPAQGQYWLSYIDALFQADQLEAAREVLALAQQHGLQGNEINALAVRLEGNAPVAEQTNVEYQHAAKESLTVSKAVLQSSKKKSKSTLTKADKSAKKSARHKGNKPSTQQMNTLATLFTEGRYPEAAALAQAMTVCFPRHGFGWKVLGTVFQQMGRSEDALIPMQKAAKLSPGDAEAHNNLGNTLQELGRLDEAESLYRRALTIKPNYTDAHYNLGNILKELGRLDESEASHRRALTIKPDYAEAHNNLGLTLNDMGCLDEAEASYRRALEIKPDFAEAYNNLGNTLQELGRLDEAETLYWRALTIKPNYTEAHYNLGNTLQELGRLDEAETLYRQALMIKPDYAEAYNNLGLTLNDLGCLDEVETSYRRALEIKPDYAEAHYNLGITLNDLGRLDEAEASYRRALEIKPDYAVAHSNLLFLYAYHSLLNPHEYLAQARSWEQACLTVEDRHTAHHRVFQPPPLAGRRLRVGYVSGDYRQHAVSYFIEQLFSHHDQARIELFAYSTRGQGDAVTGRLQALTEHWVSLVGMPDAASRERIEADGIDVLIDLSGHTAHNRLGIFVHRAAPVQAHYLGYFASTGLTEMDYWIGDAILTPAETDSHFSERVWRLPRVWVSYDGKVDAPVPAWRPSQDGTVWLGSFNNLGKLTPATLALWAKLLHALPEGKLLLKTKELSDMSNRQRILDSMSGHGILPHRIELQDRSATSDWSAHMAYYDRLDIALDSVGGVGGGTTTCDALWMGVPVIALEGDRMGSRMTASMLNAIGRTEWIAGSEEDYIDKVVALARNVEQRKALRFSQRNRMAASPLCDARGLAMSLENAYFEMFERWLARDIEQPSCS